MNMELTPEEEGARLKVLLGDRNKAQFAKENHVPGGPSMLSQHLSGHRPISLGAASAYARGLGVAVEAFSPRLAKAIAGASVAPADRLYANTSPGNAGAGAALPAEMSLGQTLARLGQELGRASPQTRAAVADLLSRYAQNPAQGQSLAQAIEMLVRSDTDKKADV